MFPLPADDPNVDVRQWMGRGVFFDSRDSRAYRVLGVDGIARSIAGRVIPRRGEKVTEREAIIPYRHVALHWPLGGAINFHSWEFSAYVERVARRQYARTFQPNQMVLWAPRMYELTVRCEHAARNVGGQLRSDSVEMMQAVLYPEYPSGIEEAEKMLRDGWHNVAFNRRIILVPSEGKSLVYRRKEYVGYIIDRQYIPTTDEQTAMKVLKAFHGEVSL